MDHNKSYKNHAERIYYEWDKAWRENDIEAFLALYTSDAIVESPVILHLLGEGSGICHGKAELRDIVELAIKRKPRKIRQYYRTGYLSNKNQVMWEYPRNTPDGEQMDFVEIMDLNDDGLIQYHRVYWGWRGFKVLQEDAYNN